MTSTDVFVAGGGPAGLAAAIAARRKGFRVLVADPAAPGRDKACGEGLMPDGIAAARAIGLEPLELAACPFRGIRFYGAGRTVAADFPQGVGLGVRRPVLHHALVRCAERAGVQIWWGARAGAIRGHDIEVAGRLIRSRFIVGADGSGSRVRAWSGLDRSSPFSQRIGFRRHFAAVPSSSYMEVHWSQRAQLYLTPVGEGRVCAALISRDSHLRVEDALGLFPEASVRLRTASIDGKEQGGVTATRRLRRVIHGSVALVGDASGSVDAITGQGLSLAFQQGLSLAEAMAANNLELYQIAHRRLMRRPRFMANLMLSLDGRPMIQRCALAAMSLWPQAFRTLLAFHVGAAA
jgi:menaquinone-9 beta-reductase